MALLDKFKASANFPLVHELVKFLFFEESRCLQLLSPERNVRGTRHIKWVSCILVEDGPLIISCVREVPNVVLITSMVNHRVARVGRICEK
jgi:hypothetical protein